MAEITSSEEIQEWLKDKPKEVSVAIAVRAAMRVVPIYSYKQVRSQKQYRIIRKKFYRQFSRIGDSMDLNRWI